MYNHQLETFIRVADAGSFNKAAEESYITPTAIIKQINLLEDSLGIKLFERTRRGLTLTKAGRSMYQDAKYIIQYCHDSVIRARNAMQEDSNVIRIGSSPMTPAQLLMELWSKVQTICPDIKFQIVPFENTPENAREILANLGTNIDVVGGIFDETMLHLRKCAGLELVRRPFYCAVSIHHKLAAKDRLQITDLYGENLLLMHRGWSHYVDELRDDLWQHHPQVNIVDFEFYSMIYSFYGRLSVGNMDPDWLAEGDLPPTFYVYGTEDPFYRQFQQQYDVIRNMGISTGRIVLNGWPHGFGSDGGWVNDYAAWLESVFANKEEF